MPGVPYDARNEGINKKPVMLGVFRLVAFDWTPPPQSPSDGEHFDLLALAIMERGWTQVEGGKKVPYVKPAPLWEDRILMN